MTYVDVYGYRLPVVTADTYSDDVWPGSPLREHGYVPMRGCIAMRYHREVPANSYDPVAYRLAQLAGKAPTYARPKYHYPGLVLLRYLRMLWARSRPAGAMRELSSANGLLGTGWDREQVAPLLSVLSLAIRDRFGLHNNSIGAFMSHLYAHLNYRDEYAPRFEEWKLPPVTGRTLLIRHEGRTFLSDPEWIPNDKRHAVARMLAELSENGRVMRDTGEAA